ncbi:hypothetical protein ACP275_01G113800 [Erythranthe tilingii]
MNRIVKLLINIAVVNCPKPSRGFSVLLNETAKPPIKFQYLCRKNAVNVQSKNFSSSCNKRVHNATVLDERALEAEAERKIGWLLKLIFAGTATVIGYNIFPYMGENVMQQSVSLLRVKDPLFKRMGASRLARFAIDDKRRMQIVEKGGARELVNMLASAKDDRTRKEALNALVALSKSDEAVGALHEAGAIAIIRSTPDSVEHNDIQKCKSNLLSRFQSLRYDISSSDSGDNIFESPTPKSA